MNYLLHYMEMKGVDISNKRYSNYKWIYRRVGYCTLFFIKKSGRVICENPTHHAALKLFRLHGLEVHGIDMHEDGIDTNEVEKVCVKKILILLI